MQCPCGAETIPHQHEVKTRAKAREWYPGYLGELPITVYREVCPVCGRQLVRSLQSVLDGVEE